MERPVEHFQPDPERRREIARTFRTLFESKGELPPELDRLLRLYDSRPDDSPVDFHRERVGDIEITPRGAAR